MPTVKIFGLRNNIERVRDALSDAVNDCVSEALKFPIETRLQRFFPLAPEDFRYSPDRSERYTIIEISMFEGRSVETKKRLVGLLYERVPAATGIARADIDITIFETPRHAWGLQGHAGDEDRLRYEVEI